MGLTFSGTIADVLRIFVDVKFHNAHYKCPGNDWLALEPRYSFNEYRNINGNLSDTHIKI